MKLDFISVFVLVSFFILFLFTKLLKKYKTVKINKIRIKAEIADNVIKKTIGLMFRKFLPKNEGMLFIFDKEGYHPFWTINMRFPIDIIWINKEKRVVKIVKNAQPFKPICNLYNPKEKAKYVLEVNANFTTKNKIKVGTKLDFTF